MKNHYSLINICYYYFVWTVINRVVNTWFLKVLSNFVDSNGSKSVRLDFYGINNAEEIEFLIENKYSNLSSEKTLWHIMNQNTIQSII